MLELLFGNSDRFRTEAVKALREFDNGGIPPAPDLGQNCVDTSLSITLLGLSSALDEALEFYYEHVRDTPVDSDYDRNDVGTVQRAWQRVQQG